MLGQRKTGSNETLTTELERNGWRAQAARINVFGVALAALLILLGVSITALSNVPRQIEDLLVGTGAMIAASSAIGGTLLCLTYPVKTPRIVVNSILAATLLMLIVLALPGCCTF